MSSVGLGVGGLVGDSVGFDESSRDGSRDGLLDVEEGPDDASRLGASVRLELDVVDGIDVGLDEVAMLGTSDGNRVGAEVGHLVGFNVGAAVGALVGAGVTGGCVIREGSLMQ